MSGDRRRWSGFSAAAKRRSGRFVFTVRPSRVQGQTLVWGMIMNLTRLMRVVAAHARGCGRWNRAASLWQDQAGATTVMVAFAVPAFVGALGVGIDTGAWYIEKQRAQQQADAAALGAARMLSAGQSGSVAQAGGIRDAGRAGYVAGSGSSIVVNTPPTSGAYAGKTGAAEAIVTKQLPSLFSKFLLRSSKVLRPIKESSSAGTVGTDLSGAFQWPTSRSSSSAAIVPLPHGLGRQPRSPGGRPGQSPSPPATPDRGRRHDAALTLAPPHVYAATSMSSGLRGGGPRCDRPDADVDHCRSTVSQTRVPCGPGDARTQGTHGIPVPAATRSDWPGQTVIPQNVTR